MRTLDWIDGAIEMIDQTLLPQESVTLRITDVPTLVTDIKRLAVRGAPALGVAGGFGVVLAAKGTSYDRDVAALRAARPTAVNLARMVDRVDAVASASGVDAAITEALAVRDEELVASTAMGELGADLLLDLCGDRPLRVMTICNTGGLATVERGTALAVVQTLHERNKLAEALPVETRPLLQGGRLTTWELQNMGAPHRLMVDSAGPFLLSRGEVDVVVIGADRVAANGDTANKIGSFSLSLGCCYAGVPFVVVAPESTIDMGTGSGADIDIEERPADEVAGVRGVPVAPEGTNARNPAFDVTPVNLITALVTNQRVVRFDQGASL